MKLQLAKSTIRSLTLDDAPSLAANANNRNIWRNLRDALPHPYHESDAVEFISRTLAEPRPTTFAIAIEGHAVGAIGLKLNGDVERIAAEIGYWLGQPYWGRGALSEAVPAFTEWAMAQFDLVRLEAAVFEWNPASARVLEKSGYVREGTMRRSALKDGQIIDRWLYAYVAEA